MQGLQKVSAWHSKTDSMNTDNKPSEEEVEYDTKFNFGDIVENYWASSNNPHRIGIVIRSGKYLNCTDGKGDYWSIVKDKHSKTKIIGHYSNSPLPSPKQEQGVDIEKYFDAYFGGNDNVSSLTKFAIIEFTKSWQQTQQGGGQGNEAVDDGGNWYDEKYANELIRTTGNAQDSLIKEIERLKAEVQELKQEAVEFVEFYSHFMNDPEMWGEKERDDFTIGDVYQLFKQPQTAKDGN